MAMTATDVLKLAKEKEVKFVDLRFTDTRGKEQHVTVPAKYFTMDKFENGHAFDGSSIAGWKGIEASDMLLMPDPDERAPRPVHRRAGAQHQLRRLRALRHEALRPRPAVDREEGRGLPQVDRARRHRLLRPGARVLHLRLGDLERRHVRLLREDQVGRGAVVDRARNTRAATWRTARRSRAATSRCRRSTRCSTSATRCASRSSSRASRSRCITTKWPPPARTRSAPTSRRSCSAPTGCRSSSTRSG